MTMKARFLFRNRPRHMADPASPSPDCRLAAMVFFLFCALVFPLSPPFAKGEAVAAEGDIEVSRRVLILFNGNESKYNNPADTRAYEYLIQPLNHLGFSEEYADVNQPLPDYRPYRAVIWFSSYAMERPQEFLPWILDAMRYGVRVIFPDGLYAPTAHSGEEVDDSLLADILSEFGLEPAPTDLGTDHEKVHLRAFAPEKFSYETDICDNQILYPVLRVAKPGLSEWLRLEMEGDPERHGCGVVVGDAGAWALSERLLFFNLEVPNEPYRVAWRVDPYAFLSAALGYEDMPRPDVTTFYGMRGAYSHVDVDGPANMSQDYPGVFRPAFDLILTEVLEKYPYPVTLGLIAAEYDPALDIRLVTPGLTAEENLNRPREAWEKPQSEEAKTLREIVARAFALPHTQAGCHAYTHPLEWRSLGMSYDIRGYTPTYEQEVRGGVEYLNQNVLPPDKPVELFQWTGDCDPPEEAFAILSQMGLANINGGDPLYDGRFNSVYYICPFSILKGPYRQIHTSGANENIYTDEWVGFKGSYNNVVATFERSESPRRFLPVNIYYHAFPAERMAGLKAIQNVYNWAAKRELCWMRAAEYVYAAEDFFRARIGLAGDGGWWVEDYGDCRTMRFDAGGGNVDMERSRNVAGFVRHNGDLYVSLLPGDRAEIRFGDAVLTAPCLARSTGILKDVETGKDFWQARARIWGPGFIELWAPEGDWNAVWSFPDASKKTARTAAERLADGRIRVEIPAAAGQWVGVRFEH